MHVTINTDKRLRLTWLGLIKLLNEIEKELERLKLVEAWVLANISKVIASSLKLRYLVGTGELKMKNT